MNSSIFKAYDIRGKVGSELTPELSEQVGRAIADWLPEEGTVVVGRDMRHDSDVLKQALVNGLRLQGRNVIDIGQVTTDMMYFAIGYLELAGGVMITASHNAKAYNGIKIYRDKVTPVGLDAGLAEIRDKVVANDFVPATDEGTLEERDITKAWIEHALRLVDATHWPKFNVAIDAGNGMAGAILPYILPILSLKVEKLFFAPDGSFPNHEPNPQVPENLRQLIEVVQEKGCDFGVAFDGDGDRAAFVDDKGRIVQGSDLITLIAKHYLQEYPGSDIIHDVRTSRSTQEFIQKWGGKPVRTKAGRVNVGKVLRERHSPFGGETTGHLFFGDNFDADSGLITMLTAIQAIADSKQKLSELIDEYRTYEMISETNFTVADPKVVLERLSKTFADGAQDWLDGLTVNYPDYWFNLRVSNTEPLVRLNAEAKTKAQLDSLVHKITHVLTQG